MGIKYYFTNDSNFAYNYDNVTRKRQDRVDQFQIFNKLALFEQLKDYVS